MILRKFENITAPFSVGQTVFLVTRRREILEGFRITDIVGNLVSLSGPELSDKQGFTIEGTLLKPSWCEGRRRYKAACLTRMQAEALASRRPSSV